MATSHPVAVPQPQGHITADELLAYCRSNLSAFKRPSGAALLPVLPTTGIGKAAKAVVRQMIEDGEIALVRA